MKLKIEELIDKYKNLNESCVIVGAGHTMNDFDYKGAHGKVLTPTPRFPSSFSPAGSFVPRLNYWVTSFGKIHRPGCSFYERGRGSLTSKPNGSDCRICGGRNPKR